MGADVFVDADSERHNLASRRECQSENEICPDEQKDEKSRSDDSRVPTVLTPVLLKAKSGP